MSDIYYYGNQPMLKYTEDGTPKAIPVPQQAADRIAELEGQVHYCPKCNEYCNNCLCWRNKIAELEEELRQSDAALEIAKIANRELKDELIAVEKNCDYWADRGKELEAQVSKTCLWEIDDVRWYPDALRIVGEKLHRDLSEGVYDRPNYCPACGGKVVSDE